MRDAGAKPTGGKPAASEQTNGAAPGKADKSSKGKSADGRPVDLSLLHLKVGVIKEAKRHPDADTLYVEEIDCGEPELRTVSVKPSVVLMTLMLAVPNCQGHAAVPFANQYNLGCLLGRSWQTDGTPRCATLQETVICMGGNNSRGTQ